MLSYHMAGLLLQSGKCSLVEIQQLLRYGTQRDMSKCLGIVEGILSERVVDGVRQPLDPSWVTDIVRVVEYIEFAAHLI